MPSATNSSLMRLKNEKIILSLINKEPISRADIAKKTGLTKAAVTIIAEDLISRGIVTEEKHGEGLRVGRTPIPLRLCTDSLYFIGINIRRTGICVGICDICGKVLCQESFKTENPELSFVKIGEAVRKCVSQLGIGREKIYKASVVTPGPVDSKHGTVLNPPNFNAWHGVRVTEKLEKILDVPVILSNVSSAMAAAERYFGAAKKAGSFMTLIVDEGIGSGIMLGDRLFAGSCELGHITVKYDGERCECGNIGCLEKYASVQNILAGTKYKSWSECTAAYDMEIMSLEAEYLSAAIVTATNIFDLDSVFLCGAISEGASEFLPVVREKTLEKMILKKDFEVLPGSVMSQALIPCAMGLYDFLG